MKVKIEANHGINNPDTHTSGGGLFDLPCTQGQLFMDAKLFNGTTKYHKFLLSPKINLFRLHKMHGVHGNPSGTVPGSLQADPRLTLACCTYFHRFFSLPLIQGKQAVSYWRNKMVAK